MGNDQAFPWRLNCRKLREVGLRSLQRLDGARRTAQWGRTAGYEEEGEQLEQLSEPHQVNGDDEEVELGIDTPFTPLNRKTSAKARGRYNSIGETTPIERR